MRRLVLVVLAVLLPLQFAWGAVAGYCQHESGGRSHHFGHHEHIHKAESKKAADGKLVQDHDCGTCHAAGATALVSPALWAELLATTERPEAHTPQAPPSTSPKVPYRPNWSRLA